MECGTLTGETKGRFRHETIVDLIGGDGSRGLANLCG